jgi:signal transduction histidine kinase
MSSRLSELPHEEQSAAPARARVLERLEALVRRVGPRVAYGVTALLLVALCIAAARYYAAVKSELTEVAMARRVAVAQLAAATLSERLDRMLDVGVALATRVRFAELVAAGQWDAAIQVMKSVPSDFRFVERVALFDARGTAMAAFPESSVRGQNFASREWYTGVSREWKPHVSGIYRRSTPPQRAVFAVAVPVMDRAGGPAGILQMQIQLEHFFDWAQGIAPGADSVVYVVDGKGAAAFDSRRPVQTEVTDLSSHPAVARLLGGASGVETLVRPADGREYVYAYMPGRHGWDVVVEQPAAQAFAARDAQLRFVQFAYGLTALILLGVAWLGMHELRGARRSLARHAERLRMLHEIDRAVLAEETPEQIAAAVVQPLRELLGVPRAIVNRFDLAAGEVEWVAAAGRRRVHTGPGVRYSIRLMGDVEALRRGETQIVDVQALPASPETAALLASGVRVYMVVPMLAGGELLGALSFGGPASAFPKEHINIVREVAAQLAIAITQANLLSRVKDHAAELESRVRARTAELDMLHSTTLEISKASGSTEAFTLLLRKVCEYSGWCFAQTWLPHAGTSRLKLGAAWYSQHPRLDGFREENERLAFAPEGGALERAWRNREPQWVWELQPAAQAVRRALMLEAGFKSWIGVPVIAEGEAIAVIEFFDTELRPRDERTLQLISTLANQVGPVIERKRAAEQIDALNANLQRYTVELESTNKELESFSYSVSHDLRAPLRAVDGYARMLEEDYRERLDVEGQRLLRVVRESSSRMGRLIDDLLAFSRLGRQEPAARRIDMERLVAEVVAEVRGASPAAVEVAPLPAAEADPAMLKQVWLNLVGNAFKYSGKRADARIQIGARQDDAEQVYSVRDNGVGFDMRYAAKLYGVFQRLHRAEEFPGTGVGLAIVQRVVTRHGGRVWAESKLGEGACFYFSLPRRRE